MSTKLAVIGLLIALFAAIPYAQAQKETERYIPIGRSPGLSGKYTYLGSIEAVDARAQTITITGDRTVKISAETRIWLDRTRVKQTNLQGSFADLKQGRKIEIKFQDPERQQLAEWVKVELTEP